jgi:hypothetical protein
VLKQTTRLLPPGSSHGAGRLRELWRRQRPVPYHRQVGDCGSGGDMSAVDAEGRVPYLTRLASRSPFMAAPAFVRSGPFRCRYAKSARARRKPSGKFIKGRCEGDGENEPAAAFLISASRGIRHRDIGRSRRSSSTAVQLQRGATSGDSAGFA